jgi:SAM-dependent methyltransferase
LLYDLDMADMADPYALTAEFYDLVSEPLWDDLAAVLAKALGGSDPSAGPVVDLGAGTGLSTVALADAVPGAEVVALEPSPSMRAVLMSRLRARRDLRERVSVVPSSFSSGELPARLGGMVAMFMIGHLDAEERAALWRLLAERLASGAPAVVGLVPPEQPAVVAETSYHRTTQGVFEYEGSMAGQPSGAHAMDWTMTYRVRRDGELVDERVNRFRYWTVGSEDVAKEAAAAGLEFESKDDSLVVLRRGTPG